MPFRDYPVLTAVSRGYPEQEGTFRCLTTPFAAPPVPKHLVARLACLIHAANVHSEPGSNPSIDFTCNNQKAIARFQTTLSLIASAHSRKRNSSSQDSHQPICQRSRPKPCRFRSSPCRGGRRNITGSKRESTDCSRNFEFVVNTNRNNDINNIKNDTYEY